MDERVAVQPSGQSTARFLLEMIVLFAVLGSPYLMFDPGTAKLVMGALALGYLTPSFYRCLQQSRVESPIPWWRRVLVEVYTLSGGLAALLLIGAAGAGWILWAFPIVPLQTDPELSSLLTFVADIFSKMIIGSLVCCGIFLGSLALLYQRKQFVGNLPRLLRANGSRILHAPLGYLGFAMATLSLLLLAGNITASGRLYEVLTGDAEAAILELLVFFPILPFSLLAAAALLVVNKSAMFDMHPVSSIVWPFHGELHNDAGHVDGWARMVLVTAVACIAILAATVHPIHFGLVTAFSSVKGISPTTSTITLVEE